MKKFTEITVSQQLRWSNSSVSFILVESYQE